MSYEEISLFKEEINQLNHLIRNLEENEMNIDTDESRIDGLKGLRFVMEQDLKSFGMISRDEKYIGGKSNTGLLDNLENNNILEARSDADDDKQLKMIIQKLATLQKKRIDSERKIEQLRKSRQRTQSKIDAVEAKLEQLRETVTTKKQRQDSEINEYQKTIANLEYTIKHFDNPSVTNDFCNRPDDPIVEDINQTFGDTLSKLERQHRIAVHKMESKFKEKMKIIAMEYEDNSSNKFLSAVTDLKSSISEKRKQLREKREELVKLKGVCDLRMQLENARQIKGRGVLVGRQTNATIEQQAELRIAQETLKTTWIENPGVRQLSLTPETASHYTNSTDKVEAGVVLQDFLYNRILPMIQYPCPELEDLFHRKLQELDDVLSS